MPTYQMNSINIGRPMMITHEGNEIKTSLFKKQVNQALFLYKDHFQGDEQAALINHSGEDKAVWPELPQLVQNTGYTGFYFRVLKEGTIERNATIELLEQQKISINDANRLMYHDKDNLKAIEKILDVKALSSSWRNMFLKRLEE